MEALTGEPPRLLDGTPFDEVARERGPIAPAAAVGGEV